MTEKNRSLEGRTILIVQPVNGAGEAAGSDMLAFDVIGAGIGDYVLLVPEGGAARQIAGAEAYDPIDVCIAGIIDRF